MMPLPLLTLLGIGLAAAPANPVDPARSPGPPKAIGLYLYDLSSSTGVVPSTWARLTYARNADEIFVVSEDTVRIFNEVGMEVYAFGGGGELGSILAVATIEDNELLVLSVLDGKRVVTHCDFRGAPLAHVELTNLPRAFQKGFRPDDMAYDDGNLYLVDSSSLRVVVTDAQGEYKTQFDIAALLKIEPKQRSDAELGGFSVSGGNMLFTFPALFTVARITTNSEVRRFGARGSTPGRFNIVGKAAGDERGNIFVTDRLRSVVMVFDKELRFLGEFGYRGWHVGNLLAPLDIAAGNGKVFVAQASNRGVSVFKVGLEPP